MQTRKAVEVPELDHDAMMLFRYGHKISPNGRLERRIVAALCAHLAERGWLPAAVHDGDGERLVHNTKSAMELIFNLDDALLYFTNSSGRRHWVRLVMGNGTDIISDYSYSASTTFDDALMAFDADEYA